MKTKTIPIDEIICESNRNYTKDTGFEQLVKSIEKHGVIQAPTIRQTKDGFRIIAGRRRIAAKKQLGHKEVVCVVREKDDPVDDEELALAENVNRQDMHPLDEAAAFRRMADAGTPIEEIARYYARSPSAIYKRLRLVPLIDELKNWFRDGILDIAGAALLAELPEEDQKQFCEDNEEYGNRDPDYIEEYGAMHNQVIEQFIYKRQKNKISGLLGEQCKTCEKRTHNSGNVLFEEFDDFDDVCLDGDCFRTRWYLAIDLALTKEIAKYGKGKTDEKIFFKNGVPAELYKKATHANFSNVKYEVLKTKGFEFLGETDRKNDACWEIGEWSMGDSITVRRVGYKERVKEERPSARSADKKVVESYGKDVMEAVASERGTTTVELMKALQDKKVYDSKFTREIEELVYERVIAKRIEAEASEVENKPIRDYLSMFLYQVDDDYYSREGSLVESKFNDRQKRWLNDILETKSLNKFLRGLPDDVYYKVQRLFHFLLLCVGLGYSVPGVDDLKDIKKQDNFFFDYAGMSKDEYRALYIEAAKDVVAEALEPKPKKGGKKKAADSGVAHSEDVPADDSGADSSSSKQGKGHARTSTEEPKQIRKCKVCGFADDECQKCDGKTCRAGCSWVEDDLCFECKKCRTCKHNSSCTLKDDPDFHEDYCDNWELPGKPDLDEDNYPFEPDDDPEEDPEM